jgi:thiamine biosynthesis lipoprotein
MMVATLFRRTLPSCAAALCVAACTTGGGATPTLVTRVRIAMGSELQVSAWTADGAAAAAAFDAVFAEFDRLDGLMSVWKPESDITRLNEVAGDHPVPVSDDVRRVLAAARRVSEWTGGKFDVTWGVLSGLWRFDHDQDNRVPDMGRVRSLLPLIDYRSLIIDEAAGTAFLAKPGMRAHLGGIGKGYAIDRAVEILRGRRIDDFTVQAGGDMYVSGLKDGKPWRLGIQDPRGRGGVPFATIALTNSTLSTSGDYERFFIKDGRRYHHIIDPVTGEPSQAGCRSVTILTTSATLADGLSTGVFLLGPEKGMALIQQLPDVDAVIVTATNAVLTTPRLKGRLMLAAPPTDAPF